jgi:RHS repeat-associated protein
VTGTPALPADVEAIWRASYEPFGKAAVDEDPDGDTAEFSLHVRFPGQYEDRETGWHFNMHRTYDPATGRYLEPDPARQSYLLTQAGAQFHIPTLAISAEEPGRVAPPEVAQDREATRLRTLTLRPQAGDGDLFSYGRNAPVVYRDPAGAGPIVGTAVCLSAALGLGAYSFLGWTDFASQLNNLRQQLDALDEILAKLREACAPLDVIQAWQLERLRLAEQFARTQAAATLQDATLAALGIGGSAACAGALALPTP